MPRYVVQHEFDYEPTYIVDTLHPGVECITLYPSIGIDAVERVALASRIVAAMNEHEPAGLPVIGSDPAFEQIAADLDQLGIPKALNVGHPLTFDLVKPATNEWSVEESLRADEEDQRRLEEQLNESDDDDGSRCQICGGPNH